MPPAGPDAARADHRRAVRISSRALWPVKCWTESLGIGQSRPGGDGREPRLGSILDRPLAGLRPDQPRLSRERRIVVARGRDYADISPLKGIYRGPTLALSASTLRSPA